ncbi:TrsI protein [Paenibacillus vortex V453]|uniref:TrsI protein n=1 Tax=Paenibacillus vortex V453 TaxID=715225 RepID=A0A2R9SPQ4_9BACL|nr:hypothetical protein [Paenibacillus vortex]EFU39367.1 TrsI protein [Paenibacillus vortex V453]
MITVLAEKPDQARKLAAPFPHTKGKGFLLINPCKEFPGGAKVTWAIGHLVELKNPDEYNVSLEEMELGQSPYYSGEF